MEHDVAPRRAPRDILHQGRRAGQVAGMDVELADADVGVFVEPAGELVEHARDLSPVGRPGVPMIGANLRHNASGRVFE